MLKEIIINEVENSGFEFEKPNRKDFHSKEFLGSKEPMLGKISALEEPPIIFDNGIGWKQVALDYGIPEIQYNKNFDTYCCVIYGIAKAICYYLFKVYGIRITISEMYNAFYAGVVKNRGTSVRKGLESFRTAGWVEDKEYPFTDDMTINEFFKEPPKEIKLLANGKLTKWNFHWEVISRDLPNIFDKYKRTLVILSGFAWASYLGEGVYHDYNNQANHLFLGLEALPNGNNLIDDTYPKDKDDTDIHKEEMFKELHKTFNYGSAHRCWLTPVNNNSIIKKIMDFFVRLKNGAIYWGKKDTHKIQKITPENAGLAAITHIMRKEGENTKNISDEELKNYEVTEEFFGTSSKLGVSKNLTK